MKVVGDRKQDVFSSNYINMNIYKVMGVMVVIVVFHAWAFNLQAHEEGKSVEQEVGEYTTDIGYDAEDGLIADVPVLFDFRLFKKSSHEPIQFSHVSVRVEHDNQSIFSASVASDPLLPSSILFTFPEASTYTLIVNYYNGSTLLVQIEAPLVVRAKTDEQKEEAAIPQNSSVTPGTLMGILAGILIGTIFGYVLKGKTMGA